MAFVQLTWLAHPLAELSLSLYFTQRGNRITVKMHHEHCEGSHCQQPGHYYARPAPAPRASHGPGICDGSHCVDRSHGRRQEARNMSTAAQSHRSAYTSTRPQGRAKTKQADPAACFRMLLAAGLIAGGVTYWSWLARQGQGASR
jgi:hypothetical protein